MMVEEEGAATFVFANAGEVLTAHARIGCSHGFRRELEWCWWQQEMSEKMVALVTHKWSGGGRLGQRWCGSGRSNRWQHDEVATFRREQRWSDVVLAAKGDVGGKRVMVKEKEIWVRVLVV